MKYMKKLWGAIEKAFGGTGHFFPSPSHCPGKLSHPLYFLIQALPFRGGLGRSNTVNLVAPERGREKGFNLVPCLRREEGGEFWK